MLVLYVTALLIALLYAALLLYYRRLYVNVPTFTMQKNHQNKTVAVIIPARNEAQHIKKCISSIIAQSYPAHLFEIIVVDDHSDDETPSIVTNLQATNIKLLYLKDFVQGAFNAYKKKAIEVAIANTTADIIITTDADCIVPPNWLQHYVNFFNETNAVFVAAPVFIQYQHRFIEVFQSVDFMSLQGITTAVVHANQMTMCNGANMAYTRKGFYEVNGFNGIDTIASGDDMLLMHKFFKHYPQQVKFLQLPAVIVNTAAVQTIQQFFQQRIRWASKADKYDDKRILPVLLLVYFLNVLLLFIPLIIIFYNPTVEWLGLRWNGVTIWCSMFALKFLAEWYFMYPVAKFFNAMQLWWYFPLMQPFHIVYTVVAGWLGKWSTYQWKERKVQ